MNKSLIAIALLAACVAAGCAPKQEAETTLPMADTTALAEMAPATDAAAMPAANPMVGGAEMFTDKDIIDNAVNSKDHTTLVTAVKAAGLVDTLKGPGPFTVFAPTNAAFDALPAGTVDKLLKPDMKADLTRILTYHVVPGKLEAAALSEQIAAGGGSATLNTAQGEALIAKAASNGISLTDAKGNVASVTTADVYQSNGVIHVVDKVLMP